jgi:hypothetical protein
MPREKPKPARKAAPTRTRLHTLEVSLIDGPVKEDFLERNPIVYRVIQIRGDQTLEDLHNIIFRAFDRDEEHLYEFQVGGKRPADRKAKRYQLAMTTEDLVFDDGDGATSCVEETQLDSLGLKARQSFFYWFDFGDDWWHQIKVVSISDELPPGKFPQIVDRVGDSPPQYQPWDDEDDDFEDDEDFDLEEDIEEKED